MITQNFSTVSHLIKQSVAETLSKIGIIPNQDVLTAYCEHCFSRPDKTYITLEHQDPQGVIEFYPLNWDSEIYGMPIGAFGTLALNPHFSLNERFSRATELVSQATKYAFDHQTEMLTCRVPLADLFWIQALEDAGFRTMDVQCPMALTKPNLNRLDATTRHPVINICDALPNDIEAIISFGRSAFGHSHLYADPRLPKKKTDELHDTWLRNDFNGRADFVLIGEDNGRICSFVAGIWDHIQEKIIGFKHGHIDLIAVTEDMRGLGIGNHLTAAVLDRFFEQNAQVVTVSTQATNLGAIRLYQRQGFHLLGFEVTLHAWRK